MSLKSKLLWTSKEALEAITEYGFRIGPLHFYWFSKKECLKLNLAHNPEWFYLMNPEQRKLLNLENISDHEYETMILKEYNYEQTKSN